MKGDMYICMYIYAHIPYNHAIIHVYKYFHTFSYYTQCIIMDECVTRQIV